MHCQDRSRKSLREKVDACRLKTVNPAQPG